MRNFRKCTCKSWRGSCEGRKVKAKFVAFLFFYRDYVLITLRSRNAAIARNGGMRTASWGNGDYMLVWHDVFNTEYFLFVPAFKSIDHLSSCESGLRS